MALSQSTLATELEAMVPAATEAEGIDNFANAFETYFYDATCGGFAVNANSLAGGTTAMKAAMVGVSVTGPASISAGITAFWGFTTVAAASIWTVLPIPIVGVTLPPLIGGVAAAVAAAGTANISGALSLEDSAAAMALAIHPLMLGGLGLVAPPPAGVTLPIL